MTEIWQSLLLAGGGCLVGAVVAWGVTSAFARRRERSVVEAADSEREAMASRLDAEMERVRRELEESRIRHARAEANLVAANRMFEEQKSAHTAAIEETKRSNDKSILQLREAFEALSAEALNKMHPEFIKRAGESFEKFQTQAKGELEKKQMAVDSLVKPIKDQLKEYQESLARSQAHQASALGAVEKHLQTLTSQSASLATETQQLRQILHSNQARGRWGEETLRRVIEAAGMSNHCDFVEQARGDEGKPDLIVRLPGDRMIIVDSKVPDFAFLTDLGSMSAATRGEALKAHAQKLKQTIKALNDRNYPNQFPNALDHVVLFLPAESLFSAALEGDHELILWAQQRRILLATPASLIALLRSVSLSWQQHAQTENARRIADGASELYKRVRKFVSHLEKIRAGLERASKAYNDAVGSYERSVRPSGERVLSLGIGNGDGGFDTLEPAMNDLRIPPADEESSEKPG